MRGAGLVAVVVLCSCGEGAEGGAPTAGTPSLIAALDGSWSRPLDEQCSVSLRIDTTGSHYAAHRICLIDTTTIGDEVENGHADLSTAGWVTFQPMQASCPTADHRAWPAWYALRDGQLSLRTADGELTFRHLTPGAPYQGTIRSGCWRGEDFTDHPLQDL
jgi:hypothetical protein